jgi:hypothetical protein
MLVGPLRRMLLHRSQYGSSQLNPVRLGVDFKRVGVPGTREACHFLVPPNLDLFDATARGSRYLICVQFGPENVSWDGTAPPPSVLDPARTDGSLHGSLAGDSLRPEHILSRATRVRR